MIHSYSNNPNSGGSYPVPPDACQAVRESQVQTQLHILGAAIEQLQKLTASLNERLKPVVMQEKANDAKTPSLPPNAILCPLAEQIRTRTQAVNGLASNLDSLLGRLEV